MTQTAPQFKIRMSAELREKLMDSAKANNRSVNAEIVSLLTDALESVKATFDEDDRIHMRALVHETVTELMTSDSFFEKLNEMQQKPAIASTAPKPLSTRKAKKTNE